MSEKIEHSIGLVQSWVEQRGYKGYDPGDGLTSFLRPVAFGNLLAERILQQAIWKSPINLRPVLGVVPLDSTKGRGFMAWGYTLLHRATGKEVWRTKTHECLRWLDGARERGYAGHCWGNHFDFSTRSGCMKAHTPTIVWSGLIGQAFLEAYEEWHDHSHLQIADSICRWILTLPRESTTRGSCLSYTAVFQNSVHNSNLLGAALLGRVGKFTANEEYLKVARAAVEYSCSHQRPDGSWWYGEAPKYHWIDNFHTAYNLDSLRRYIDSAKDNAFLSHLDRGYEYFKKTFFEATGRPRYYHDRTFPVDIQCAAQAIDTFSFFSDRDPEALDMAMRVAEWTIANLQDRSGYFYYREYPMLKARTPYFHWGQATMFKALAHLLSRLRTPASRQLENVANSPLS
jgi:polysaccharide biosynthesis protein VpsJ